MTLYLCRRSSDYYEISQADVKWHTHDVTHVKVNNRNTIPFCETGSSFISAVDRWYIIHIPTQIDFHFNKETPSLKLKREVHFRLYGRHFDYVHMLHSRATVL